MPPMGNMNNDNKMGDDIMMGDKPSMNEPMDDEPNNDEGNNPKKHIQQLAGELSQSLRMYNQQQKQPDTDLNKYVMGMVVAQAAQDMTPNEKDEIVKKIQNRDNEENIPMEECKESVNEISNSIINDGENDEKRFERKTSKRKNPFISNR